MALYFRTIGLFLLVCASLTNCGTTRPENVNQKADEINNVSFLTGKPGGIKLSDVLKKDPSNNFKGNRSVDELVRFTEMYK